MLLAYKAQQELALQVPLVLQGLQGPTAQPAPQVLQAWMVPLELPVWRE